MCVLHRYPPLRLTKLRSPRASLWAIWGNQNSRRLPGEDMDKPRAADDFATIRARLEELRRQREGADDTEKRKVPAQTSVRVNRIAKVAIAITRLRVGFG